MPQGHIEERLERLRALITAPANTRDADDEDWCLDCEPDHNCGIDWVIVGGESGPGARPTHPDWVRSLRDQCAAAGVPFLFKQWGEWLPAKQTALHAPALMTQEQQLKHESQRRFVVEHNWPYWRLGKNNTGRTLDGREHTDFPA